MTRIESDIVICGAGPVGLYAALELHRNGIPLEQLHVIDRRPTPDKHGKANLL